MAHASYIAGTSYDDLGRPDGRPYLERAVAIYQQLGDDRGLATASNNLGIHHYTQGRWDEAVALYAQAREADARAGDPVSGAVHANNEAEVLSDQGRLDEAEPLFVEMVHVCRAAGFPIGEALGTSNLGRVAARSGRFAEAHALYVDAERLFTEIRAKRYVNETRARVAEVMVFEGRYSEALAVAEASLEAARETPFGGLEALVERMAGYALVQGRRKEEGWPRFLESLRIARDLEATYEEGLTLRAMADTGAPRRRGCPERIRGDSRAAGSHLAAAGPASLGARLSRDSYRRPGCWQPWRRALRRRRSSCRDRGRSPHSPAG